MGQLVSRADEAIESEQRVRLLMQADSAVVSEVSLPLVLQRIVESARELVGAQYATLGVISPLGSLEQFIQVGMDADTVCSRSDPCPRVGPLPNGPGLLGALIHDPRPIRLAKISADGRSSRFPAAPPGHGLLSRCTDPVPR